ncbi:MAG: SDR family oxidoreductase [Deltaproteobacteria bacterium]|nr:SDR family oxidoreductase [Deltaproteobacteria bacterium]
MAQQDPLDFTGKHLAVLGVADESSIAWAMALAFHQRGALVRVGHQQKFLSRVTALLARHPGIQAQRCDVLEPGDLGSFFQGYAPGTLHGLIHAVAYGPAQVFTQPPSAWTREDFNHTLGVSAHSLAAAVGAANTALAPGGSVITLSFQAARRHVPWYGAMATAKAALESLVRALAAELGPRGIRVNAVAPGPIETLAALGEVLAFLRSPEALAGQEGILPRAVEAARREAPEDDLTLARRVWKHVESEFAQRTPLGRALTAEDAAGAALFLASPLARAITGQVLDVDGGLSSQLGL